LANGASIWAWILLDKNPTAMSKTLILTLFLLPFFEQSQALTKKAALTKR
jgi:hypothetical protein